MLHITAAVFAAALLQAGGKLATPSDSAPPSGVREATAQLTFDFGAGATSPIAVRGLELKVSNPGAPSVGAVAAAGAAPVTVTGSAEVSFLRAPGAYTSELTQHSVTGERLPAVTIEVVNAEGKPAMTIRLQDVLVSTDRVIMNASRPLLEEQRLNVEDGILQISADLTEAERQKNLTEALDKKKLSSPLDVARVRSQVEFLRKRLDVQMQRLALLRQKIDAAGALDEQVVLTFTHFDVDTAGK